MTLNKILKTLKKLEETIPGVACYPRMILYDDGSGRIAEGTYDDIITRFNNLTELEKYCDKELKGVIGR